MWAGRGVRLEGGLFRGAALIDATVSEERDEIKFGGITGRTKMITNYRHNNLLGT